jgi:hypothetical protein
MFTEYEIDTMMNIPAIQEATYQLKKDFITHEAPYLDMSDHDFFSLIMMAPTIRIAMADGNISFFEERALNKKARKLSKGGYFMEKDPVVNAMKFLIKKFDAYQDKFFGVLNVAMHSSFNMERMETSTFDDTKEVSYEEYKMEVLNTPYIVIRFIVSFFLENDEDIISDKRKIGKSEYQQMISISEKVGLNKLPVFHMFCKTFDQKA